MKTTAEETAGISAQQDQEPDDQQLATREDAGEDSASSDEPDIDQLLNDPDAFEKVNAALVSKSKESKAGEDEPAEGQPQEVTAKGKEPAAASDDDPDPVVDMITFFGQSQQVRKSEQRNLLQKGRYLEHVLQELRPLRVIGEDKELMSLAAKIQRLPKGKEALKEALRNAFEQALPEVEGYSREEVAAGHRLMRPLLEAEGVLPSGTAEETAGAGLEALPEVTRIRIQDNLQAALENEPSIEEAAATMEYVNRAILEADRAAPAGLLKDATGRVIPAQEWAEIRAAINDPNRPEVFRRFFREMGARRRADAAGGAAGGGAPAGGAPAAGAQRLVVKAGALPRASNQDRLGAGASGDGRVKAQSAWDKSEEEFEKLLRS